MPTLSNPELLKQIYDAYRTALMHSRYYAYRLKTYKRWDKILEIALAVGTSGTIASLTIWKTGYGEYTWAIIAGLSAFLAILKPILNIQNDIERYSQLHITRLSIFQDFQQLVSDISIR